MQRDHMEEDRAAVKRIATDQAIRAYALAAAGTDQDLDPLLEAAGVEFWLASSEYESGLAPADTSAT